MIYYIAHNIIRNEVVNNKKTWVHRKGATKAAYKNHPELKGTIFENVGHPILLPGNPIDGSTVMVAQEGSKISLNSVNHGAGRVSSRTEAKKILNQKDVDFDFIQNDILSNCRSYPLDESKSAYKSYKDVIESVEEAALASTVAKLTPLFVVKDDDKRAETSS
jgi:tRNA-splicing ligase RtcB